MLESYVCVILCFTCLHIAVVILKDFIYLFERKTEKAGAGEGADREGEVGSPLSREPNMGPTPGP